ncbi:MAG: hypothetical protein JXQ77_03900 [Campylobacterales bacterium]|nr:hypothetical protein [Campylobacterales bacterium]
MKKLFLFVTIVFGIFAYAKSVNVDYIVRFGVIGDLGRANIHLNESNNRYTIDIKAKTIGMVKVMSGDRTERHISKGHIVNGKYVSDSYNVHISRGNKIKDKIYTINHKTKTVVKRIIKKENGKVILDQSEKLSFYSSNDLLSMYMNIPKLISPSASADKIYRFQAVGAENQDGNIEIFIPSVSKVPAYKKELGDGAAWYFKAIINQPIFASKRGEFMIAMDKDGVAQKAVLQDLILFGDLVARKSD